MMAISTGKIDLLSQKQVIELFDHLKGLGKKPELAIYNGRLIIYKKRCDSLLEKIQQMVERMIYTLNCWFGRSLDFQPDKIQKKITLIENAFIVYCTPPEVMQKIEVATEKLSKLNKQIEETTAAVEHLINKKAILDEIIETSQKEIANLKNQLRILIDL